MIAHGSIVSRVAVVAGIVLAAVSLNFVGVESASDVKKFHSYDEYTEAVADGSHVYVTAYKASWCGHCKRLAPIWVDLAAKLQDVPNLVIAEVECPNTKQICDEVGVKGFPTIKSSFGGEVKETYKGMRDTKSLENFARAQAILWTSETTQ